MNAETPANDLKALKPEIQPSFMINAQALRAAAFCQGKNDLRYYLNGIFIKKEGKVIVTNGHIGFITQCDLDQPLQKDLLIKIQNQIPKAAVLAEVIFLDEHSGIIKFSKRIPNKGNPFINASYFSIIDTEHFPDAEKAFKHFEKPVATDEIGIDSGYLSLAAKVFNNQNIVASLKGRNAPLTLTLKDGIRNQFDNEASMIIMPCSF